MKEYMTPAIELVEIETASMMATSLNLYEEEINDPSEILSREFNFNELQP